LVAERSPDSVGSIAVDYGRDFAAATICLDLMDQPEDGEGEG
jgi:hypothetical protein